MRHSLILLAVISMPPWAQEVSAPDVGEGVSPEVVEEVITNLEAGFPLVSGGHVVDRMEPISNSDVVYIRFTEGRYEILAGAGDSCKWLLQPIRRCDVRSLKCSWEQSVNVTRVCI